MRIAILACMKLKAVITFLGMLICVSAFAQSGYVDSLRGILNHTNKQEGAYLGVLNDLALYYSTRSADSTLYYAKRARDLAADLASEEGMAQAFYYLGLGFTLAKSFDSALVVLDRAGDLFQQMKDSAGLGNSYYAKGMLYSDSGDFEQALSRFRQAFVIWQATDNLAMQASALRRIGVCHVRMGDFPLGLENFQKALHVYEFLEDTLWQARMLFNIGTLDVELEEYERAIVGFQKAYDLFASMQSRLDMAMALNNLGYNYKLMGKWEKALPLLFQALKIHDELGQPCRVLYPQYNIGSVYERLGRLDSADYYLHLSQARSLECRDQYIQVLNLIDLGSLYQKQGKQLASLAAYKKALDLAETVGMKKGIATAAGALYAMHKAEGRYAEALKFLELSKATGDSIFNDKNSKRIARLEAEFVFEKERQELLHASEKRDLQYAQERARLRLEQNVTIIGLIFLALTLLAVTHLYFQKQHANEQLRVLNNEKNKLIGMVAHDLHSPISQVRGLVELIKGEEGHLNPPQVKYLDIIMSSCDRSTDLIERVLDVSAIESYQLNLKVEEVELNEVLELIASNFDQRARKKHINIRTRLVDNPAILKTDRSYLIQILENLVSNALKFSQPHTTVEIRLERIASKFRLSVNDQGPGLSREDQNQLFQPFARLTPRPTAGESSTGLGLSIVKKFTEALSGKIWCESELGKGTTFIVEIRAMQQGQSVVSVP